MRGNVELNDRFVLKSHRLLAIRPSYKPGPGRAVNVYAKRFAVEPNEVVGRPQYIYHGLRGAMLPVYSPGPGKSYLPNKTNRGDEELNAENVSLIIFCGYLLLSTLYAPGPGVSLISIVLRGVFVANINDGFTVYKDFYGAFTSYVPGPGLFSTIGDFRPLYFAK